MGGAIGGVHLDSHEKYIFRRKSVNTHKNCLFLKAFGNLQLVFQRAIRTHAKQLCFCSMASPNKLAPAMPKTMASCVTKLVAEKCYNPWAPENPVVSSSCYYGSNSTYWGYNPVNSYPILPDHLWDSYFPFLVV